MPPGACGIAILRHGLVTEHPHNQASCRDAVDGHLTLLTVGSAIGSLDFTMVLDPPVCETNKCLSKDAS